MKGWYFAQSHSDFTVFFFFLLDNESPQVTRADCDDDRLSFCARSRQRSEVKFSFEFSTYHHESALLSLEITTAVWQVTPALLWKNKGNFQKNARGRIQSSLKNARWGSGVLNKSSKASSKPKAPELERLAPNLTKARETEKLSEMNVTLERKEVFSSFERKSSLESLPKTFWSGRVPPTPATCHSPMTDISVIRPLRWSFWWRIYPSYGTKST